MTKHDETMGRMTRRVSTLLLAMALSWAAGCGSTGAAEGERGDTLSKAEASELSQRADDMTDYCGINDWYGDGVCDDFCIEPDPDCAEACPEIVQPPADQCPDGQFEPVYASTEGPTQGEATCIERYECVVTCPELTPPSPEGCAGEWAPLVKGACTVGYQCVDTSCPAIHPPSPDFCVGGEVRLLSQDGCATGYDCVIGDPDTCPVLSPPAPGFCPDGTVVARISDGCVRGYDCAIEATERTEPCPAEHPPFPDFCADWAECPEITPPSPDFCAEGSLEAIEEEGCVIGFRCA